MGLRGQKDHPNPVLTSIGKLNTGITSRPLEELMGNLQENARTVARAGITSLRTTMSEVFKNLQALLDDMMRFLALDIDDKAHPTGVLFLFGIVQPLLWGKSWNVHVLYLIQNVGMCPCQTGYSERGNLDWLAPYPRLNPSAE